MSNASAHALVQQVWGQRGFPIDPVWIANKLGLRVIEMSLGAKVSVALLKEQEQDPVIILNRDDSRARRRFVCAHELGHYVMCMAQCGECLEYEYVDFRADTTSTAGEPDEVFANEFAASLLMPAAEIRRLKSQGYSFVMMASYFGVSDDAMRSRLM